MKQFLEALTQEGKKDALPEEFDYFGKLFGSWKRDNIDNSTSCVRKGDWHFCGFLREWRYRVVSSCSALNTGQRFASTLGN